MLTHNNDTPAAPKRVSIIGAGGFIGGAIATLLERRGVAVRRVGRSDVDLLADGATRQLEALLAPGDAVVAVSALAPCKNRAMLLDNMRLADVIISALEVVRPDHVINISSDAVYADLPLPLTECSPMAPEALHGVMHVARERMFASSAINAPLASLRPTLVYGARDPHNGYGPNQFRRKALAGEDITLFGEGEERRDHVHVDDVAELAVRMLFQRSSGALNAATGVATSFREMAERVVAVAGTGVAVKGSPRKGPMPHNGYRPFDPAATYAAFPDFRYRSLDEGLVQAQVGELG